MDLEEDVDGDLLGTQHRRQDLGAVWRQRSSLKVDVHMGDGGPAGHIESKEQVDERHHCHADRGRLLCSESTLKQSQSCRGRDSCRHTDSAVKIAKQIVWRPILQSQTGRRPNFSIKVATKASTARPYMLSPARRAACWTGLVMPTNPKIGLNGQRSSSSSTYPK